MSDTDPLGVRVRTYDSMRDSRDSARQHGQVPASTRNKSKIGQIAHQGFVAELTGDPFLVDSDDEVNAPARRSLHENDSFLKKALPLCRWLQNYSFHTMLSDLIAGLTLSLFLIPQGLAYSSLVPRMPVVNGLFVCILPAIIYAFFGGSAQISVGPESVSAMLLGSFTLKVCIDQGLEDTKENMMSIVFMLLLLEGITLVVLGVMKLGFLDSVLIRSVMTGMIMAVGVGIMISQSPTMLGYPSCVPTRESCPSDTSISRLIYLLSNLSHWNPPTAYLSLATLAALWLLNKLKVHIEKAGYVMLSLLLPPNLIVVGVAVCASYVFDFAQYRIKELGTVVVALSGMDFPSLASPVELFNLVEACLVPAATMGVILFAQSSVIGKEYASKHSYSISSNSELVALGLANIVGSFFNTLPACGSFPRSKVNDMAGALTPMAGLFSALFVLIAVVCLLPVLSYLPMCVMASLVFFACTKFIADPIKSMKFLAQLESYRDTSLLLAMFALTMLFGVSNSIFFGFGACLLFLIRTSNLPIVQQIGKFDTDEPITPGGKRESSFGVVGESSARPIEGWLILAIVGKIHFANAGRLKEILHAIDQETGIRDLKSTKSSLFGVDAVCLDLREVPSFDSTAVEVFMGVLREYKRKGLRVVLVRKDGLDPPHLYKLIELAQVNRMVEIFTSLEAAISSEAGMKRRYSLGA